jgi:hypothetical protein
MPREIQPEGVGAVRLETNITYITHPSRWLGNATSVWLLPTGPLPGPGSARITDVAGFRRGQLH